MDEKCERCGEYGEDRRTLWMACFYDMMELGIPLNQQILLDAKPEDIEIVREASKIELPNGSKISIGDAEVTCKGNLSPRSFYTMRVCKDCRAAWLEIIQRWFKFPQAKNQSCGSGIFIRHLGTNIEVTEEEYYAMHKKMGKKDDEIPPPVRLVNE